MNLQNAVLRDADLTQGVLARVNANGADFGGAKLFRADLKDGDFSMTRFDGADLSLANLNGSTLNYTVLIGADLHRTDLGHADLYGVNLAGADLRNANLAELKSCASIRFNSKNKLWPRVRRLDIKGGKLDPPERKTRFGRNDTRNVNWAGAALLKRYVEDENFLIEYEEAAFPWWRRIVRWAVVQLTATRHY